MLPRPGTQEQCSNHIEAPQPTNAAHEKLGKSRFWAVFTIELLYRDAYPTYHVPGIPGMVYSSNDEVAKTDSITQNAKRKRKKKKIGTRR